jgi:conjugal transfer pilus assembly protein TrbC
MLPVVVSTVISISLWATSAVAFGTSHPSYQEGMAWAQQISNKHKKQDTEENKSDAKTCCQAEQYYRKVLTRSESSSSVSSDQDTEVLIFISFSMPEASLKALSQSMTGCGYKTRLVLRGLVDNSFRKTATRIRDLETEIEINPQAFEIFDIKEVPTFVRVHKDREVARLKGNVTLGFAIDRLREAA